MKKLIGVLKVYSDNIKILHRNLFGEGFFADHELIGGYYEMLDEMIDDVAEIGIALGISEPNFLEASGYAESLKVRSYNNYEAFNIIRLIFEEIIDMIDVAKDGIPSDVVSKLEEYQYNLRKEAQYKIAQRLFKI
jgi:DNA-binding ferritin-like protein